MSVKVWWYWIDRPVDFNHAVPYRRFQVARLFYGSSPGLRVERFCVRAFQHIVVFCSPPLLLNVLACHLHLFYRAALVLLMSG